LVVAGSEASRFDLGIFDNICAGGGNALSVADDVTIGLSVRGGRREE
jgi:hypothetical protein